MINSKSFKQDEQGTEADIEVNGACILGIGLETNGFQGGDSGHGGRTRLWFTNVASVDMTVEKDGNEITLQFGGDEELRCLAEGLRFIADALDVYRGRE